MSTKPDKIEVPADTVLGLAAAAVYGDRQRDYGSPHINHATTAAFYTVELQGLMFRHFRRVSSAWDDADRNAIVDFINGFVLVGQDVCCLNILQKLSRQTSGGGTRDTWTDIAGYAENGDLCDRADATASDGSV